MADITAQEITQIIKAQLAGLDQGMDVAEVGTVVSVGDGIARVYGLEKAMSGELLEFPDGVYGLALNLEEDNVGCVLMGETNKVREGSIVKKGDPIVGKKDLTLEKDKPVDIVLNDITNMLPEDSLLVLRMNGKEFVDTPIGGVFFEDGTRR